MVDDHSHQYDHTQDQSHDDVHRAKQLSLQRTHPPAQVEGYEIKEFLGAGAYGEVWIGLDLNTGRLVAIKFFIHRGGVDWSLLSREVEKLVFLSADRYVVQLLEVGWESDPPYYVMEYVENGSLEEHLREHVKLPVDEAVAMFRDLAIGLVHAHSKGVLHCDIKPANILLDQDQRPRLADFGQSRLTHEQTPSLGTLFYMAPEQARLDAVPDARWDVYALGAMLYCVLTGLPPHRSPESLQSIDTAGSLENRLSRYQELIHEAPVPQEHRQVDGMDRRLAQIIDRCLATDPQDRYANAQEIVHALDEREAYRRRRPLLLLGIVTPILLLSIMAAFGVWLFQRAINEAQVTVATRVHEGNEWIANHVASRIENDFKMYFGIIQEEASSPDLQIHLQRLLQNRLVQQSTREGVSSDNLAAFLKAEERMQLDKHLQDRMKGYLQAAESNSDRPQLGSVFVISPNGTMLAVAYDRPVVTKSVGRNYSYRTYFHGGAVDLPKGPQEVPPLAQTHLSAVFQSSTTKIWKIAVSTPIRGTGGKTLGVIALTVNLGEFPLIRSENRAQRFSVLVDGRPGPTRGTILQHPLFDDKDVVSEDYSNKRYRVPVETLRGLQDGSVLLYDDPLGQAKDGAEYRGKWIGGVTGVSLPERRKPSSSPKDDLPELIVLVQENYSISTAPLLTFSKLIWEGIVAVGVVLLVIVAMWVLVARSYRQVGANQPSRTATGDTVAAHERPTQ